MRDSIATSVGCPCHEEHFCLIFLWSFASCTLRSIASIIQSCRLQCFQTSCCYITSRSCLEKTKMNESKRKLAKVGNLPRSSNSNGQGSGRRKFSRASLIRPSKLSFNSCHVQDNESEAQHNGKKRKRWWVRSSSLA